MAGDLGPELRFAGAATRVSLDGKELLFFAGNDYHRLSRHPEVIEAFRAAAASEGLSSAGSRITTGNHPLYRRLEEEAARFLGVEGAAVAASGYLSPLIVLQAAGGDFDRFFIDAAAHSSLADAARTLPADRLHEFAHSRPEELEAALRSRLRPGERPLAITEGVVPGTGEVPPLADYARLVLDRGGKLLVDDAHGIGVLGSSGRGSPEEAGLPPESCLRAATLSKALGSSGGLVAGPGSFIAQVHARSLAFIGSTGPAVPLAAAAVRSLELLRARPECLARLRERSLRSKARLRAAGFAFPDSAAPILSVSLGDPGKTAGMRAHLLREGVYPPLIRYPGSPPGGHFRFTLSSAHSDEEVERLLAALVSAPQ